MLAICICWLFVYAGYFVYAVYFVYSVYFVPIGKINLLRALVKIKITYYNY